MILTWGLRIAAGAACLALAFVGWVYAASEAHLRSFPPSPPFAADIPADAAAVARGAHLTKTRGCAGCHGADLAGAEMGSGAVAPNLPALARSETPASLEAAVRRGLGRDGRALYSMPSYNFVHLRDGDLADIIAYLRTRPVIEKELPRASLPWSVRYEIAMGRDAAMPAWLDRVPPLRRQGDAANIARGEYFAMTTCNECHGFSLRADVPWGDDSAPDLIIAASYPEEDFRRLLREGIAMGGRELEMMSPVARGRFADLSDEEIADLHAFLRDMAERALTEEPG